MATLSIDAAKAYVHAIEAQWEDRGEIIIVTATWGNDGQFDGLPHVSVVTDLADWLVWLETNSDGSTYLYGEC